LIGPESKEFLVFLFTDLRRNLDERGPRASEEGTIFDALLDGLRRGAFLTTRSCASTSLG